MCTQALPETTNVITAYEANRSGGRAHAAPPPLIQGCLEGPCFSLAFSHYDLLQLLSDSNFLSWGSVLRARW